MQLLEILATLNDAELAELESQVTQLRRPRLKILYAELRKRRSGKYPYDKEKVFAKVFGSPYKPADENKWKYEVRSLKTIIYQYLANIELQMAMKDDENIQNEWVMKALFRRQADKVLDQELDKLIKKGEEDMPLDKLIKLYEIKSHNSQRQFYTASLNDEEHKNLLDKIKELKTAQFANELRSLEMGKAALMRRMVLKQYGLKRSNNMVLTMNTQNTLSLDEHSNAASLYYQYQRDSQLLRGEERIQALLKSLEILPSASRFLSTPLYDRASVLYNITMGYYASGQLEKALEYAEQLADFTATHNIQKVVSPHLATMRIYLGLERYEAIVDYYQANLDALREDSRYALALLFCSYAYLYLGKTQAAIKVIVSSKVDFIAHDNKSIRLVYVIAGIIDHEWEVAERELQSFISNTHLPKTAVDTEMAEVFRKYISIQQMGRKEYNAELSKLDKLMAAHGFDNTSESLPYQWLKHHLKAELNIHTAT